MLYKTFRDVLFYLNYYHFFSTSLLHSLFFLIVYMFIYLFWERRRASGRGAERVREGERTPSRLRAVSTEPRAVSISQTVRSWPELTSRVECLTDWATQAPHFTLFKASWYPRIRMDHNLCRESPIDGHSGYDNVLQQSSLYKGMFEHRCVLRVDA